MLWTNSIKSKATGIALGAQSLGIHLHPALLIEGRSEFLYPQQQQQSHTMSSIYNHFPLLPNSHKITMNNMSIGNQLYLREPCDEGTILALIPNTAAINLSNLKSRGILSSFSSGQHNNNINDNNKNGQENSSSSSSSSSLSLFGPKFLGTSSSLQGQELVWRLAVEIAAAGSATGHVSPWWHWVDSLKEELLPATMHENSIGGAVDDSSSSLSEYYYLQREAISELERNIPASSFDTSAQGLFENAKEAVEKGREDVFRNLFLTSNKSTKNEFGVVPNLKAWNLAFEALRLRSVLTISDDSSSISFTPSILPIIDLCAHSHQNNKNSSFESNVAITMIDKTKNKFNLPSWVEDLQKQDLYEDIQEQRLRREEMRFAGVIKDNDDDDSDFNKKQQMENGNKKKKGPRKPLSYKEKMEKQMLFSSSSSSSSRNQKQQRNSRENSSYSSEGGTNEVNSNNNIDYYYALELTKPCRAGEILRLDWFELSPGPHVVGDVVQNSAESSPEMMLLHDLSHSLFMWQRFKVVVPSY